jgi:hypothetical protein
MYETIGLYDVDSTIPNLPLMKLSTFWRDRGAEVVRWYPTFDAPFAQAKFDRIFASAIFKDSDKSFVDPARMICGGTGFDLTTMLPPEVDACAPDYTLYNYPHSIGFTQRGCRFRCKFCVVPEKEGRPKSVATIEEIWQQRDSDFIMLLDNDFFGGQHWKERIAEIRKYDLRINFSQGLNIRIITDEQARALASVKFCNPNATKDQVHFAWDRFKDEKLIDAGIERVRAAGIKPRQMAFFVLIGYDTTPEQDLYRVMKLAKLGCDPYVMPFNSKDPYQQRFKRWVNRKPAFKSTSWEDYNSSAKNREDTRTGSLFDYSVQKAGAA